MWPFSKSPLLDAETAGWHEENFRWLIRQFGESTAFARRDLVQPTPQSFSTGGLQGDQLAAHVLEQVKDKAGLAKWPTRLAAHDSADPYGFEGLATIRPEGRSGAAGTFSASREHGVLITYSVRLLSDPHGMVATFAHELAHYLLATRREPLPVPREEEEFLTDLTAVFLGFGLFLCNTRFRYEQFQAGAGGGWRWNRQGYLPESDLLFATALFLRARRLPLAAAEPFLKPYLRKNMRRAYDQAAGFAA